MAGDLYLTGDGTLTATGVVDQWTDLAIYTDAVRNVIARPGTFADLFPETTDDHLVALLADALAEAHLMGLLLDYEADDTYLTRPVLTSGQGALLTLFAGLRLIRGELLNRITSAKYVAGPVSSETTYATNILRDIMKALETQKEDIVTSLIRGVGAESAFMMADSYVINSTWWTPNGVGVYDWLVAYR